MKKIINSFRYAFRGIKDAYCSERNMQIHLLAMILVVIAGYIYHINTYEWIICITLFALVISLEMVNTAIERVVDLVTKDYHELAAQAKDIAAGAVLVTALFSSIIGLIIFIPKIF